MKGKIIKINRGKAIFEDPQGDYGYFEFLGDDDLEEGDIILGNLHFSAQETIKCVSTGKTYSVYVEDWGMSYRTALEKIY